MKNMTAANDVDTYTELAQIALTWMQYNLDPNDENRRVSLELLNRAYGQQALYTGFQVALAMLLRHGAEAAHINNDTHIARVREIFNAMAQQQHSH